MYTGSFTKCYTGNCFTVYGCLMAVYQNFLASVKILYPKHDLNVVFFLLIYNHYKTI